MRRRNFIKAGAAVSLATALHNLKAQEVPTHNWDKYDFGPGPAVSDRLNQGPFGIEQDQGWYTVLVTSQSTKPVKNYGLGLLGYTWEEGGPSLAARAGTESLEQHVEKIASLPFVDVLYIRCDWRDVQTSPGRLSLHPVFKLTLDAARRHNLRVAFRIQMSNTEGQPGRLALPEFVQKQVPLVKIGKTYGAKDDFVEPRYDHPRFQAAFKELNELLVREFDDVRVLGRRSHQQSSEPVSGLFDRREDISGSDSPAIGSLEKRATRREHATRHQQCRQQRDSGSMRASRLLVTFRQYRH
jgi:hypothetical protein